MSSFYSYKEMKNHFDGVVAPEDYTACNGDLDTYDMYLEEEVKRIEKNVSDKMLKAIDKVLDDLDETELLVLNRSQNLDIASLTMQYLTYKVWGVE